jgi:hypothetical protein
MKGHNEKNMKENKLFQVTKCAYLSLFLLELIASSFLIHFTKFKVLWECKLTVYKSSWSAKGNETTSMECLVVWFATSKSYKIFLFELFTF